MKRNKTMNRLILCAVAVAMVLSAFPMMTGALDGDDGSPEPGRANELVIDEITVLLSEMEQADGAYVNGVHGILVNYTIAQEVMNVNVTLNATHDGMSELNTAEFGNFSGPATNFSVHMMDFTAPGMYTLNVTMEAWLNGTGKIYGYKQIGPVNFTTVIDFDIDVTLQGSEAAGAYAKHPPIQIGCTVNFTGNVEYIWANLTVTVTNTTSLVEETEVIPAWMVLKGMTKGIPSNPMNFWWTPSVEGPASNYEIKVTATNTTTGLNDSYTEVVQVTNLTIFGLEDVTSPEGAPITLPFSATAFLNNTGNVDGAADVCLSVYEAGDPANEAYNSTETSGNIDHISMNPTEMIFTGIVVAEPGDYKLKVRVVSTGESIIKNLTTTGIPNVIPELDHTPPEDPWKVKEGMEAVFTVTYTDEDDHQGNVTLCLDDVPLPMVNATADWDAGVVFTYTWVAETVGDHSYYFFAEDILGGNNTLMNATDEQFPLTVTEKTDGMLYGKVTDANGNVSDANLTIYSTKINATNATVLDAYFNTTTDANGNYSEILPFSGFNYVIRVEEEWMAANGYTGVDPTSDTFLLDSTHQTARINFTLEKPEVIPTCLKGNVNESGVNLSGVGITIVVFADVVTLENITVEGVNTTVNVTTRTWMNMTATTDVNGSFSIEGVPFTAPAVGDLTATGTKRYVHGVDTLPIAATVGKWEVTASKTGYDDVTATLEFSIETTTWWNISMVLTGEPPKYQITGRVQPAQTVVTLDGTALDVDPLSSTFTAVNLTAGAYSLKFTADGYITQYKNVTIVADNLNVGQIILLLDIPPGAENYTVTIGPFKDGENTVSGITVSFTLAGVLYESATGSGGIVEFEIPVKNIPAGTLITAKKGDTEITWSWGDEAPYVDKFVADKDAESGDGSDVLLIVAIVVIVFIIIILVVLAMKSKGVEEEELFDEEIREYECPSCGAIVTSDMEVCPECGETFEEEEFRCPECGELVEKDSTLCDSCGAEFEMPEKVEEEEGDEEEEGEEGEEEPEAIGDFEVEDESETEGVDEMAEELEEEDELGDLEDDLDLEDI